MCFVEPVYKSHLSIQRQLSIFREWPQWTGLTVFVIQCNVDFVQSVVGYICVTEIASDHYRQVAFITQFITEAGLNCNP